MFKKKDDEKKIDPQLDEKIEELQNKINALNDVVANLSSFLYKTPTEVKTDASKDSATASKGNISEATGYSYIINRRASGTLSKGDIENIERIMNELSAVSLQKKELEAENAELNRKIAKLELEREKSVLKLEFEIDRLNRELDSEKKQLADLKDVGAELQNKNLILQKELEEQKRYSNDLSNKLIYNENQLSEFSIKLHEKKGELIAINNLGIPKLKEAYDSFTSLNDKTRNSIRAIFETDSFLGFISNGMQWDSIDNIWEHTKRKIVNEDGEDVEALRRLFLILFDIFNEGYYEPPYKKILPRIGSRFNSENSLIIGPKSDGVVKTVLLEGYERVEDNVVHKALVQVE